MEFAIFVILTDIIACERTYIFATRYFSLYSQHKKPKLIYF